MPKLVWLFHLAGGIFLILMILMVLVGILRKNVYNPKLGINLLLIGKDGLGIISVRPSTGMVSLLQLPDNLVIPVDANNGEYQVGAIYKIGLPVNEPNNVARESVGQALGVVLAGVVKSNLVFGLVGLREALLSFSTGGNLSLIDRYLLFRDINELLGEKMSLAVSLPKNVMDRVEEPDGKTVYRLNSAVFVWSKNQWVVDEVLSETAEVTVVNATGKEGQARMVARQIESAGVRVIDILTSKKEERAVCLIWGDTKIHSRTAEFLSNSFLCKKIDKIDPSEYLDRDIKSDLVVILGKGS